MEQLEWLSIADYARMIGESQGAVRWAIRRWQLRAAGVYKGKCWTLYAEKRGSKWRIPILVRKKKVVQDDTIYENIVSVRHFSSRTGFLEYQRSTNAISNAP